MSRNITPNELVDALIRLADTVDPDYSFDCLESCNTNVVLARSDRERFVAELHSVALMINASGLCDSTASFDQLRLYRDNIPAR